MNWAFEKPYAIFCVLELAFWMNLLITFYARSCRIIWRSHQIYWICFVFFSCSCQRNIRIPLKFTFYLLGFFFIAYISSLQTIKAFTKKFYTKFFTVYFRAFIRCYVQILNSTHVFFKEKNRFYLQIYNIFKINEVEPKKNSVCT